MKNRFYFSLLTSVSCLLFLSPVIINNAFSQPTPTLISQANNLKNNPRQINQIAQAITVKIMVGNTNASGVIIAKNNNTYTVITNAHVVTKSNTYQIETADGKTHQGKLMEKGASIDGYDLAILEFQALNNYQVATLGDVSTIKENDPVFSVGFSIDENNLMVTSGKITHITPKPLKGGYQIGYSQETQQGMSGGALLNAEGKLMAIVGMSKGAVSNEAYTYLDNTRPSAESMEQWRSYSFAVPIVNINQISAELAQLLPKSTNNEPKNQQALQRKTDYTGVVKEVYDTAKQITVRIDSKHNGNGSGVIIAKEGETYYILTAGHVVDTKTYKSPGCDFVTDEGKQEQYTIVTPDGATYPVKEQNVTCFNGIDLAVIKFASEKTYQIATLNNLESSNFGDFLFVAGFPKHNPSQLFLSGGTTGYEASLTDVLKKDSFSFSQGNDLLYNAISYGGMSGGAILDRKGRLIGINTGAENEFKSDQNGQTVEIRFGNSLGILISTFLRLTKESPFAFSQLNLDSTALPQISFTEINDLRNQFIPSPPSKNADAFAWFNYGNEIQKNYQEEAIIAFDKAIQLKPDFGEAYLLKGLILSNQKKIQESVVALDKATEIEPNFPRGWALKGLSLHNMGKYSEALESLEIAIKLDNSDSASYLFHGMSLSMLNRHEEAIASLTKAIEISNNSMASIFLAREYAKLRQFDKALTIADNTKINPSDVFAYWIRGSFYLNMQKYDKAMDDLTNAAESVPALYLMTGELYERLNEPKKAKADYLKALNGLNDMINADPNNVDLYIVRTEIYRKLGNYQKAIDDYTKIIDLDPENIEAYKYRGRVYYQQQKWDLALDDFLKAIKLAPKDGESYTARGLLYLRTNNIEEGIKDLETAAQLFKSQSQTQKYTEVIKMLEKIEEMRGKK